ncbi:LuxR C-terminal-related transcriptional regulator [Anaeroselena agilis]|uniref:LuxR C-terminal-related transcriptional regulator n=1 Tax=Anaeroselena agilis TaxID=3063788 RepID=A0ABU3P0A1_9FIRM|nr:LuxR C-terminal-related transcriptional regulator [Selenomonadales bacterium 4137-cl]
MPRFNPTALYVRQPLRQAMGRIWDFPLTVVEAPMGYGKTTAVKECLKDSDARVLWQTVIDGSASGFWRGFCRMLKKIDAGCAERLAELGVPDNSIFMDAALELIGNAPFPARTVLVFDDFHLLSSKTVEQFLELLVKMTIPSLRIIVATRAKFGENTTELALKGFCHVVDKSDFELNQGEIIAYYKLCGVRLRPHEAAELHAYTEGWISALYLSMLNFAREGLVERQASLSELIDKAVYRQCPAEVKEFLLAVCVFDSFTLAQAQAMRPDENAEALLSYLVSHNAFIKYDKYSKTYRMHNIFTDYLREMFARQGRERRRAVLRAAGSWYAGSGDHIRAMDAYHQAGDFHGLLAALELAKGHSLNTEHKEKLIRYFRECPAKIKKMHPWAWLVYTVYLFVFNEKELFAEQCAEIRGYIGQSGSDENTRAQLAGELELLCSFSRYNSIAGMTEHLQRAARLLRGPSRFLDRKALWTFGSPSVLYMFYRESGRLEQEVAEFAASMPLYCHLTGGHGAGADLVFRAERHYYIGDFENAEILANNAMYVAQAHGQTTIAMCALFLQVKLDIAKGSLAAVKTALQQAREEIKRQKLYRNIHMLELCEGSAYACLGQADRIPAWIAKGDVKDSSLYFPAYAAFNIVYGKTLLITGQYLKLLGLAGHFLGVAGVFPNLLGQIYICIYVAAAHHRLQRRHEAQAALVRAVDIAAADGLIMPFVENGEHIGAILGQLGKDDRYAGFVARVEKTYAAFALKLPAMRAAETDNDLANLTAREREIAGLVAAGLPNRVIAKKLVIEEATVKKTLQNIFTKLGIGSRTVLARLMLERKTGRT